MMTSDDLRLPSSSGTAAVPCRRAKSVNALPPCRPRAQTGARRATASGCARRSRPARRVSSRRLAGWQLCFHRRRPNFELASSREIAISQETSSSRIPCPACASPPCMTTAGKGATGVWGTLMTSDDL